jgi:hypothetical protein
MGQEGFYREWCLKGRWPAAAVSTLSSSNLNSTTCYFKAGVPSYCYDLPGITADGRVGASSPTLSGIPIPGFGKKSMEHRGATLEVDVIEVRPQIQFATMYDDKIAVPESIF